MILHRYVARRFLAFFLGILGAFWLLMSLLDATGLATGMLAGRAGFATALAMGLMRQMREAYNALPVVALLAAAGLFLRLSATSELVVMRAAGRSGLTIMLAPLVVALGLGAAAVGVGNPLVAAAALQFDALAARYEERERRIFQIGPGGVWLRESFDAGRTIIHARSADAAGTTLFNVSIMTFDGEGRPQRRIEARAARLGDHEWRLSDGRVWVLRGGEAPANAVGFARLGLPSSLTRAEIRQGYLPPWQLPLWRLPEHIRRLEAAGFASEAPRSWLHAQLALPVLLMAMVMLGAGLSMRPTRFGGVATRLMAAILAGLLVFLLRNFTLVAGQNATLPPLLAAWIPPLATALAALGLLLHLEEG
ncbi:MAG: LPS export ABC transporter permease LptG [Alphaproteobacteria bacterium]|nr:MAG: LPS export ABC transporter permease LptG [Alphaproteobacteria bacterium]